MGGLGVGGHLVYAQALRLGLGQVFVLVQDVGQQLPRPLHAQLGQGIAAAGAARVHPGDHHPHALVWLQTGQQGLQRRVQMHAAPSRIQHHQHHIGTGQRLLCQGGGQGRGVQQNHRGVRHLQRLQLLRQPRGGQGQRGSARPMRKQAHAIGVFHCRIAQPATGLHGAVPPRWGLFAHAQVQAQGVLRTQLQRHHGVPALGQQRRTVRHQGGTPNAPQGRNKSHRAHGLLRLPRRTLGRHAVGLQIPGPAGQGRQTTVAPGDGAQRGSQG